MKKDFFTGLVLLMPFVVTIAVIVFVIKLITNPFMSPVSTWLNNYEFSFSVTFVSRLIILVSFIGITMLVGMLGRWFLFGKLVSFGEFLIQRIPVVKTIYKSFQDVVQTVFNKAENSFSEVVLVPFPHAKAHSIGLITRNAAKEETDLDYKELIPVFVPGTPNPTMGFLLFFRKEQLTPINMGVKDALKFLVSCGVVVPKE